MNILHQFYDILEMITIELVQNGIMDREFDIPWVKCRGISDSGKKRTVVLRQNGTIIGIAALRHDTNGIDLEGMLYPKIQWSIEWFEINPIYRGQGHGTAVIKWIRDKFASTKTPIALYAKSVADFDLALWYYKLGAIILWNEEYPGNMSYQCFMSVDQISEYIEDDADLHDVKDIIKWEKSCSERRICKNINVTEENMLCNWVLRNTENECGSCIERETRIRLGLEHRWNELPE